MCQCAERRAAIVAGLAALASGDRRNALTQARFVAVSAGSDIRSAMAAAKARLKR